MKPALCVLLLVSAVVVRGDGTPQVASFNPLKDSLAQETPQPIYSRDPADPWNHAFFQLFTRTVQARRLPGGVTPFQLMAPESQHLLRTGAPVTRIESGDRAIDPLYSSWIWMGSNQFDMSSSGAWGVLNEPRY